jgi:cytochrome c oxidase subunit 3
MTQEVHYPKRDITTQLRPMQPRKFLMCAFVVSMFMMFAGLSSAVLVSMPDAVAKGRWRFFSLPDVFWVSTLVVLLSSVAIQYAYLCAKRDDARRLRLALIATVALGTAFLFLQFIGFQSLYHMGIALVDNNFTNADGQLTVSNSAAFVYIIVSMHGLHLLGALVALIIMVVQALRLRVHSHNLLGLELTLIFWHALGFLWLYLFIFLSVIYS